MERQAYSEMADVENQLWWYVARRRILTKILDTFAAPDPAQTILEVGCGPGGNLPWLARYGQLHAAEHDGAMRELAAQKQLCPVLPATLPQPLTFSRRFDVICLFDVLEHVDERVASLAMLKTFLNPGGRLIVSVPAYMFLWSPHDDAVQHKLRYTLTVMKQELAAAGYQLHYATYFNTLLFPAIWLFRLLRRRFGQPHSTDFAMPPRWLNRLFTAVFGLERFIIPRLRLPFGVSLLVVARPLTTPASP